MIKVREHVTLRFYDDTGKRLLYRHSENGRFQQSVVDKYVESVLSQGLVSGVRGAAWAIEKDDGSFELITFGTLASAVYEAAGRHPNNAFVQQALAEGIPGAIILNHRIPADVLRFLRDYHNAFHQGSKYSIMELYTASALKYGRRVVELCLSDGSLVSRCNAIVRSISLFKNVIWQRSLFS